MLSRGLFFVLVVTFIVHLSTTEGQGLCTSHSQNATSDLCQEFLRMKNQSIITNCDKAIPRFSCKGRCNRTNERKYKKECFCDPECSVVGDCCVDYYDWCNKNTFETRAKIKCFASQKVTQGYVVVSGCANSWKDTAIEKKCKSKNSTDPLIHIPVYDYGKSLTFANVFCALCTTSRNLSHLLNNTKSWTAEPYPPKSAQFCIPSPTLKSAPNVFINTTNRKLLSFYCKSYSFPLRDCLDEIVIKNPHCGLLFNEVSTKYSCKPLDRCGALVSLSLLFSFQNKVTSTSSQNSSPNHVVIKYFCRRGEVYDPFHNRCRRLFQPLPETIVTTTNETFVNRSLRPGREQNQTELLSHNSFNMVIPQKRREANYTGNGTYSICLNIEHPSIPYSSQPSNEASSWLTLIGLLISITALLLFLLSNALFSELRTFFGKNLISLVVSLLLFQTTFLLAGQTEIPTVCNVTTALLHFSVLSMFSWMSVLAFDFCRTFSSKKLRFSGNDKGFASGRRLILYSVYAWGIPLIIVITCSVLVLTRTVDTGYHGYGENTRYCYLSTTGRIYCTAVPIAALLLFNFVALSRTLYSIRKVQKETRRLAKTKPQLSLVVLGLKLTSVVGLSWILGFVYAIAANPYVEYLYIIMNSLQGVFIFVLFGCNKRIFTLYKNLCCRNRVKTSDAAHGVGRN